MDTKETVIERLKALARDNEKRPKTSRILDVIDYIEAALAAGVSRADVLSELNATGLDMNLSTFNSTLARIRKRRGKVAPVLRPAQPAQGVQAQSPTSEEPEESTNKDNETIPSHNPADLDAIISQVPDLAALAAQHKKPKGNKV
ncbi:MAG: hypothetical protein RBS14_05550 [Atribacterota bacterium]|jgi:hypothetical protein|nr:hypothetical protein [Atribacterota bacterium]